MGKVKKRKLIWIPSDSRQVVGYKLYWSIGNQLSYGSYCIELGNVTEVILPDILGDNPPQNESILLGIAAIDKTGNESDIIIISKPFQHMVPPPPEALKLTPLDEFKVINTAEKSNQDQKVPMQNILRDGGNNPDDMDSTQHFKRLLDKLKKSNGNRAFLE